MHGASGAPGVATWFGAKSLFDGFVLVVWIVLQANREALANLRLVLQPLLYIQHHPEVSFSDKQAHSEVQSQEDKKFLQHATLKSCLF